MPVLVLSREEVEKLQRKYEILLKCVQIYANSPYFGEKAKSSLLEIERIDKEDAH